MTLRARSLLLLGPLALLLAAPAALSADDRDDAPASCVRTQMINDWRPLDNKTIVIRTSPRKAFKVIFTAPCYHLDWSVFARVDTRPTGMTTCLSRGDVILFGRGPRRDDNSFEQEERCVVGSVVPHEEPPPPPAPAN